MAFQIDRGKPPGKIPQILDQNQITCQGRGDGRAMLRGVPARELPENDMMNNANAVHENHEQLGLAGLRPLREFMNLDQSENMLHHDQQHDRLQDDRRQIMNPRERHNEVNALQNRQFVRERMRGQT